jgi:hypothetical protein
LVLPWKIRLYGWWEGYVLPRRRRPPPRSGRGHATLASRRAATAARHDALQQAAVDGDPHRGRREAAGGRLRLAYIPEIVKPLGLNPAMSVLDLSAGLGGAARAMVTRYGAWVNGREMSPVLAEHGMAQSSKAGMAKQAPVGVYDPECLVHPSCYDCVFAKESFFTVADKARLLDGVEQCLKSRGQLLFTDYVIDPAVPPSGAIQAWFAYEPLELHPLTIEQTINELLQRNFDVRINEDITERHRSMILGAIAALVEHVSSHQLDQETRTAVVEEVELWARRVAALDAGLRVYRFYALKSF